MVESCITRCNATNAPGSAGGPFPAALEGKPDMLGLPMSFVPRGGAGGGVVRWQYCPLYAALINSMQLRVSITVDDT